MTEESDRKEITQALAKRMTDLCTQLAYAIAHTSNNEGHLLDGIKLANEAVRSLATTMFVEGQKAKENDK